jgi:DNA polymerase
VRGMLVAAPGKDLLALDFSAIEARVGAWVLGEQWKLDAFRAYDQGKGPDLYKVAFARSFHVDPSTVTKVQRQIGKVMELALLYEGGAGAFVTMVATYGINLDELAELAWPTLPQDARESAEWMWGKYGKATGLPYKTYIVVDALKYLWRQAHPNISQGWKHLKSACEQAVEFPGRVFSIPNGKVAFKVHGNWLYMRLPSGRKLSYYKPRWIPEKTETRIDEHGREYLHTIPGEIRYTGIDTHTRRWMEVSTYGGRLLENCVQAVSRDLLVNGMIKLDNAGYDIVMTVHDEVVSEVDKTFGSVKHAERLMCDIPAWADGCPVVAEGWRAGRYKK